MFYINEKNWCPILCLASSIHIIYTVAGSLFHCCLLFHCMNMLRFIYSPTVDKHVNNLSFYRRILKTLFVFSGLHWGGLNIWFLHIVLLGHSSFSCRDLTFFSEYLLFWFFTIVCLGMYLPALILLTQTLLSITTWMLLTSSALPYR